MRMIVEREMLHVVSGCAECIINAQCQPLQGSNYLSFQSGPHVH